MSLDKKKATLHIISSVLGGMCLGYAIASTFVTHGSAAENIILLVLSMVLYGIAYLNRDYLKQI